MTLKDYRNAIRAAWLPLVGRERLTSHEYALIGQWLNESIPVQTILRAIAAVRQRGAVVYSLGVIRADLEQLRREQGRMQAGAHNTHDDDWRERWKADLEQLGADFPELRDDCRILIHELPNLTKEEAERWMTKLTSQV